MPNPLSRVFSIVSTRILRVVTDKPVDSLASHAQSLAPKERACASTSSASARNRSSEIEKGESIGGGGIWPACVLGRPL